MSPCMRLRGEPREGSERGPKHKCVEVPNVFLRFWRAAKRPGGLMMRDPARIIDPAF